MNMEEKRNVSFIARKDVTKPIKVQFKTSEGKSVSFIAKKTFTKPVKVQFKTKK